MVSGRCLLIPIIWSSFTNYKGGPTQLGRIMAIFKAPNDLDAYATSTLSPLVNSTAELTSLKCKGERS